MDPTYNLKYYFCDVSKAGCTTWENIARSDYVTGKKRKFQLNLNARDWPERNETYQKFVNIRHPFDRLVSAFYNIKTKTKRGQRGPELKVLQYFMQTFQISYKRITFPQFINFVVSTPDEHPANILFDRHWDAFSRSCRTCSVNYRFITRTETSVQDSKPILKLFDYPRDFFLHESKKENHIKRKADDTSVKAPPFGVVLAEFAQIKEEVMEKLFARYKSDFEGFGYHFDVGSNQAYCSIQTENGDFCC